MTVDAPVSFPLQKSLKMQQIEEREEEMAKELNTSSLGNSRLNDREAKMIENLKKKRMSSKKRVKGDNLEQNRENLIESLLKEY